VGIANAIKWTTRIDPQSGLKVLIGTLAIEHCELIEGSDKVSIYADEAKKRITASIVNAVINVSREEIAGITSVFCKPVPAGETCFGTALSDSVPIGWGEHLAEVAIGAEPDVAFPDAKAVRDYLREQTPEFCEPDPQDNGEEGGESDAS
jgi:hypothetical protein